MRPMLVLCSGMFRSASTWQYQVAGELARRTGMAHRMCGILPYEELRCRVPEMLDSSEWHIVKTHVPDPWLEQFFPHPGFRVLYSYRDIRDVVYSMAHKTGGSFRTAIDKWAVVESCRRADRLWPSAPRVVEQRYVKWIRNPAKWVKAIAMLLGFEITNAAAADIAEQYSLENQKRRTEQIADRFRSSGIDLTDPQNTLKFDPETMLHWNHIREGRVGHWRSLATPAEKLELHRLCGDWLLHRGYETDSSWAYDSLPAAGKAFT